MLLLPGRKLRVRPGGPFVLNRDSWQAVALEAWVPVPSTGVAREIVRGGVLNLPAAGGGSGTHAYWGPAAGFTLNTNQAGASVTLPSLTNYDETSRGMTVTAVTLPFDAGALRTVWARTPTGFSSGVWCLGLDAVGSWRLVMHDGAQHNAVDAGGALTPFKPYIVVGTHDGQTGGTLTLYVNGRSVGTSTSNVLAAISQGLTLGSRSDAASGVGSDWNGAIWDCRYYSTYWTAGQVAEFTDNPWEAYATLNRRMFFDVAAAAYNAALFPWPFPPRPITTTEIVGY